MASPGTSYGLPSEAYNRCRPCEKCTNLPFQSFLDALVSESVIDSFIYCIYVDRASELVCTLFVYIFLARFMHFSYFHIFVGQMLTLLGSENV